MIAIDKQAHFWWGWAISATLYPLAGPWAIFYAALAGAAKEVWDKRGHGTPDKWDFFATALGGAVGAAACAAIGAISG